MDGFSASDAPFITSQSATTKRSKAMAEPVGTTARTVKTPGPDHPIAIERNPHHFVVKVSGRIVADTRAALTLREATYPAVQYVPRKDVDMTLLQRTSHATAIPGS